MTNYLLHYFYSPRGLEASVEETDAPLAPLRQVGETYNDVSTYSGVYASRREALLALIDAIDAPAVVIEVVGPDGSRDLRIRRHDAPAPRPMSGYVCRVVASRHAHGGTYVVA